MKEWKKERMKERMNEWKKERNKERKKERTKEGSNERKKKERKLSKVKKKYETLSDLSTKSIRLKSMDFSPPRLEYLISELLLEIFPKFSHLSYPLSSLLLSKLAFLSINRGKCRKVSLYHLLQMMFHCKLWNLSKIHLQKLFDFEPKWVISEISSHFLQNLWNLAIRRKFQPHFWLKVLYWSLFDFELNYPKIQIVPWVTR